jgi:hypothetical protein
VTRRLPNYTGCRGCFAFEAPPPSPLCSIHLCAAFYLPVRCARDARTKQDKGVCIYARVSHGDLKWTPCMRSCTYRWPHQGGWLFAPAMRDSCRVRSSPKCVPRSLLTCYAQKERLTWVLRFCLHAALQLNNIFFDARIPLCICIYTKVMYLFHLVDKQIFNNPNKCVAFWVWISCYMMSSNMLLNKFELQECKAAREPIRKKLAWNRNKAFYFSDRW